MERQDIINYVMHTPGNTNPAVLGSMIDEIVAASNSANAETRKVYVTVEENIYTIEEQAQNLINAIDSGNYPTLYRDDPDFDDQIFGFAYGHEAGNTRSINSNRINVVTTLGGLLDFLYYSTSDYPSYEEVLND